MFKRVIKGKTNRFEKDAPEEFGVSMPVTFIPVRMMIYAIIIWVSLTSGRPPWQVYILTDFGEAKDTIILTRTHPCLSGTHPLQKVFFPD